MASRSAKTRRNSRKLLENEGIPWGQWPNVEEPGIYVIKEGDWVIYVGRTGDLRQRPRAHRYGVQAIDEHIRLTAASRLSYNYVVDPSQRCNEHCYMHRITDLQGQWPRFNMKGGDACRQCRACVERRNTR